MKPRQPERRQAGRLQEGARKPCPDCGDTVEFRESYRAFRPERRTIEPVWLCLRRECGYRQFVRA